MLGGMPLDLSGQGLPPAFQKESETDPAPHDIQSTSSFLVFPTSDNDEQFSPLPSVW